MFGGGNDNNTVPGANDQPAAVTDNAPPASAVPAPAMPVTEPAMPTYTPQTLSAPTDMTMPAPSYDAPVSSAPPAMPQPALSTPTPGSDVSDLLDIKQQALQELTPLVGQLDQTPEEKFRTTMMLIQAADNADLLKEAHEAAQGITDEKVRAQALLDVINEINYFTQQQQHAEV